MSHEPSLIVLLALPFVGSVLATLLPVNARSAEAWLAGGVALGALARGKSETIRPLESAQARRRS
jgi:multicomponent K+:H+ antiporter subunit A